jgi:hypothetical protein
MLNQRNYPVEVIEYTAIISKISKIVKGNQGKKLRLTFSVTWR